MRLTRRTMTGLLGAGAALPLLGRGARAEGKSVTIGISMPLTGAAAEDATIMMRAALLAIEEANAAGGVGGYHIDAMSLDDGTATAGQYDVAQAAVNARKMVVDKNVVAAIGPMNSGSGKSMAAILSQGNLATITPSSTNPDLSSPKFADTYRPAGLPIYFRTVTTDAYQGPNMANFMAEELGMKSVFVLDDSGAYGVGLADAFQARAEKRGIKVLGRDRVDPLASDYTALLTRIKSLNPDALYTGASALAGVKLVKQSFDIIPKMIKAGGDGLHNNSILTGAGLTAAEGWYSTIAAPHMLDEKVVGPFVERYVKRWGVSPSDYGITAYDATLVALAAVGTVAATGKPVTRAAVRDAIQVGRVQTLQGEISFDENGDLSARVVSVFQVHYDPTYPVSDVVHQFRYVGVAPFENT